MGQTKNFADVIRARMAADPALAKAIEDESFNADIAMKVYEARKEAGLTQKQLAEHINTQQSVISRIESADYDGHSLGVLKRIAHVLGKNLRVEFYACAVATAVAPAVTDSRSFPLHWQQSRSWQPHIHQDGQVETGRTCQESVETQEAAETDSFEHSAEPQLTYH